MADDEDDSLSSVRFDVFWTQLVDVAFWSPMALLVAHVYGVIRPDPGMAAIVPLFWAGLYLALAPLLAWRVALRVRKSDTWRAVACFAFGALPLPALLLLKSPFAAVVLPPFAIIWGVLATLNAARYKPPPEHMLRRSLVFAGAAVICAVATVPALAATVVGAAMAVWDPPPYAWVYSPLIIGLSLPFAAATAYASWRLTQEARRAWRRR